MSKYVIDRIGHSIVVRNESGSVIASLPDGSDSIIVDDSADMFSLFLDGGSDHAVGLADAGLDVETLRAVDRAATWL